MSKKRKKNPMAKEVKPTLPIAPPRTYGTDRIVIALDRLNLVGAQQAIDELDTEFHPYIHSFKIPLELYPDGVTNLRTVSIFLDLKLHHDPDTTHREAKHFAELGVRYFTVDAFSGLDAMRAAVEGTSNGCIPIASTLPTWMGPDEIERRFGLSEQDKMHFNEYRFCKASLSHTSALVIVAARDTLHAGISSIVCSPHELADIREYAKHYPEFNALDVFAASIRPLQYRSTNDFQKRPATPAFAMSHNARALIIGKQIMRPEPHIGSRVTAMKNIVEEIKPYLEK